MMVLAGPEITKERARWSEQVLPLVKQGRITAWLLKPFQEMLLFSSQRI
ncbi:hypothetical protein LHK_01978 [Laribacter hongkongensis HLHK9]|uniref:Uncharacterized protein n=2 Tax=Laribacter hongkongensis TaxID=168471 RepID=C1D922_LARHH|nr:hypothetical protein LHK_01978 [Laribacter hongkongensis HLHK9]